MSTSAVRHSLEQRTNSNGMKVVRSQALRGVMDISFTSDDEDDPVSDRYFDTAKNKHKSLERHNDQYIQMRRVRQQSVGSRSFGKKSFDDVLSQMERSVRSRSKISSKDSRHRKTHKKQSKI